MKNISYSIYDETLIFFILLSTGPWIVFILINCILVVLATDWFMSSKECGNYIWYSINPFAIFRVITNFRCNYLFNSHDPLSSPSSLPFIFFLKQKLPTTLNSYLIWASLLHENRCFIQRMISNYCTIIQKRHRVWHRFSFLKWINRSLPINLISFEILITRLRSW